MWNALRGARHMLMILQVFVIILVVIIVVLIFRL